MAVLVGTNGWKGRERKRGNIYFYSILNRVHTYSLGDKDLIERDFDHLKILLKKISRSLSP